MKHLRLSVLPLLLLLTGCTASAPILIASLGIAGAGLVTYCTTSGSCPPAVVLYGGIIIKEATADAIIWESGSTVPEKLNQIIANLNADIAQGQALDGLSPEAQAQVRAILATAVALVPLFEALLAKQPQVVTDPSHPTARPPMVIHLPPTTARDRQALDKMWVAVARAK